MSTNRADYIAGLRQLADVLEQHPDLPLPLRGSKSVVPVDWLLFGGDTRDNLAAQKRVAAQIVRALPCKFDKHVTANLFRYSGELGGLHVQVVVDQAAVCERVVVGTETVTREVPDPDAAPVPTVTVTETVEKVEWQCRPLLASTETQGGDAA